MVKQLLLDKTIEFLKVNNLDISSKTFVLAVSTGIDSSVLLDVFLSLRTEYNYQFNLIICHCNHHKRLASEEEAEYIENYAKKINVPCYTKDLYFDENIKNFQAEARKLRYEFFDNIMNKVNGDYLVLAHHANDNLETILMRIIRGSSLSGYAGIKPVVLSNDYLIIRPLLDISKETIKKYQEENNIKYYEDSSNETDVYKRNRLRHEVVPLLLNESPDLYNKIKEFSECLFNSSELVNNIRDEYIKKYVIISKDNTYINRLEYLKLNEFLREEVLFEILKKENLSKSNIKELIKVIKSDKVNLKIYVNQKFYFILEYDKIIISKSINENLDNVYIVIDKCQRYIVNDKIVINVIENNHNNNTNLSELWYNNNAFPLVIRTRRPGDKIKLSSGYKKVKDLLIDLKVPMAKRDSLLLAIDNKGEVLIIFGLKKSEILKESKDNNILIKIGENNG